MSDQTQNTGRSPAVTIASYCLSLLFLSVGLAKLWGPEMLAEQFAAWHYPSSFMYLVGVTEVVAGFLLMMPSARAIGALLLALIMLGAGATHFFAQQWGAIAVPAVIFPLLIWIIVRSPLPIDSEPEHGAVH
jgi:uncharacterized membrane protein YphA (DoxX/SURF4 family)